MISTISQYISNDKFNYNYYNANIYTLNNQDESLSKLTQQNIEI